MAVVRRGQAEMPQRLRAVARLLQRAQHQPGDEPFLGLALGLVQHGLQGLGVHLALCRAADAVAQVDEEGVEGLDLLGVRVLVHAVEDGDLVQAGELRHALVGLEHEFLDHAVGDAALLALDGGGHAAFVQRDDRLVNVQVQRAALHAGLGQHLGEPLHAAQVARDLRRKARPPRRLQQARHVLVDEARVPSG